MIGTFGDVVPAGDDWVARKLVDLQRQITELRAARGLEAATIGAGGLIVDGGKIDVRDGGSLHVSGPATIDGSLSIDGPTTIDGTTSIHGPTSIDGSLSIDGPTTIDGDVGIGGDVTLDGDLTTGGGTLKSGNYAAGSAGWRLRPNGNVELNDVTIRGGIIGNDALANPVSAGRCDATTHDVNIAESSSVLSTYHTDAIPVPAGFSTALVMAFAQAGGTNNSGSGGVGISVAINGVESDSVTMSLSAGQTDHVDVSFSRTVTGLSGGNVTIAVKCRSANAPLTTATVRATAIALFLR